jgi:type I restriction-modification system DNA methylase subunit
MSKTIKINSEEELQTHFHNIHNFIRNKFGLYGKSALQFFNFFFVLKLIENMIKNKSFENVNYDICSYTNLVKLAETEEGKKHIIDRLREIKKQIYSNEFLKDHIFMNFPTDDINLKDNTINEWFDLINVLDENVLNKFHAQGRLYEYFLGFVTAKNKGKRGGSQIEDLGQFFTSRTIIRYIIAKLDPELDDNKNVPTMCDSFCGSGGFIIEYIKYLNHKYLNTINWNKNIQNIYGLDTDRDIVKSALVDVMLLTNTLNEKQIKKYKDNKDGDIAVIHRIDSTFENSSDNYPKVKYNITNPPYGGGKMNLSTTSKYIKHIQYVGSVNKEFNDKKIMLTGNDKEALSLMHGMGILDEDGIYAGVLKEGVFFDKKYAQIRKEIIENYEIECIISVPQDDFWNTTTNTSIIIFKNSGKPTKQIKFWEIGINRDKNKGVIGLNEINPETKKVIRTFNPENYKFTEKEGDYLIVKNNDIKNKKYSFNSKNYIKNDLKVNKGFKIVKLGDLCELLPTTKHNTSEGLNEGKYRFYSSSQDKKLYTNTAEINKLSIIVGNGGNMNIHIDTNFTASKHVTVIQIDDDKLLWYIYYYIKYNPQVISNLFNGSTMGWLNKESIKSISIPIPEDINTIKIYLDVLEPSNEALQALQALQALKEKQICGTIKLLTSMGEKDKDYDEYKLEDICELQDGYNFYKNEMDPNSIYENGINLPLIKNNGGQINDYVIINKKFDKYICKKGDILIGTAGSCGQIIKLNIDKAYHVHNMVKFKNINICKLHFYYILKTLITPTFIGNNSTGSVLGTLKMETLRNTNIKVLKPEIIKQYGLDKDFEFVEDLKNNINVTLNTQKQALENLMKLVLNYGVNKDNSLEQSDEEVKPKKKVKPIKKAESSSESESESDNNSDSSESEEDTKPKKILKPVKKVELSDEKPKKKVKPVKKVESSSDEESSSSDSSSESEDNKSKKKLIKKKLNTN